VIPYGYCHCGCGQKTNLARRCCAKEGTVTGQPRRFLKGHNKRKTAEDYAVDTQTGCWVWQRWLNHGGYGMGWDGEGRCLLAHRVYYERHVGPIPEGLVLDHLCRNRCCVNPQHLEPVTTAENNRRACRGRNSLGQFLPGRD
jgi:hypothetical protein